MSVSTQRLQTCKHNDIQHQEAAPNAKRAASQWLLHSHVPITRVGPAHALGDCWWLLTPNTEILRRKKKKADLQFPVNLINYNVIFQRKTNISDLKLCCCCCASSLAKRTHWPSFKDFCVNAKSLNLRVQVDVAGVGRALQSPNPLVDENQTVRIELHDTSSSMSLMRYQ